MTTIRRLAVLDRGEGAVRVLAAVAQLDRDPSAAPDAPAPEPLRTIAVQHGPDGAWSAREADETLDPGPAAAGHDEAAHVALVAAFTAADADAVWLGAGSVPDPGERADLTARCEDAGLVVVGPDSRTLRLLDDPDALRGVVGKAGVPVDLPQAGPVRRVDVDVVADASGTRWVLGTRDVTVAEAGRPVLVESPCPTVGAATCDALRAAAERVVEGCGYRGVGAVRFEVAAGAGGTPDTPRPFRFVGLEPQSLVEQTPAEEAWGVDLVALHLHVARGDRLDPVTPHAPAALGGGCAVQVRLRARDVPPGARVRLLDVPAVAGVRVDGGLRPGDPVTADAPVLATLTAWGRTRAEAFGRLRRALLVTSAVVDGAATDRTTLLALLDRPELVAAAPQVDDGWLDGLVASGALASGADPVAVLAAAVEAYDTDRAAAEAAFLARAARGRPEPPEEVGTRVLLGYRGGVHAVRVDLVAPGRYRVATTDGAADLTVERLDAHVRRVTCGGRRHRVVVAATGSVLRVEVDAAAHVVTREDGVVVRAGWPAFVVSVPVLPGDRVEAGHPVAVLESMKMESAVPAPFTGVVLGVDVLPGSQVEAGAPLLRLRAEGVRTAAPDPAAGRLDLTGLERPEDPRLQPCERVFGPLRDYLLGYDLDPAVLHRLLTVQRRLSALADPADPSLLACEDSLLDVFADVGALSRPRVAGDDEDGADAEGGADVRDARTGSAQEYLIAFLRFLDADRAMLPPAYRARLLTALGRYGVTSLDRTPALEAAVVRLYRSTSRVAALASVVTAVLGRRLAARDVLAPAAGPRERLLLDRLAAAAQGRQQEVADLARDVRFHFLDEPVLESVVADVHAEVEGHLLALARDPGTSDRAHRVDRMVRAPHPLRAVLLRHWLAAGDGPDGEPLRRVLLEVYARRFYRIRPLRDLRVEEVDGRLLAVADYAHRGRDVHLVVAYAPLDDLPAVAAAVRAHLAGPPAVPDDVDVVVDVATWQPGERPDIATTAAAVAALVARCDAGRPLHRLDVTVTSTDGGSDEHARTQHLTYRQDADGTSTEDLLYRNLHPMLAKRLELWRLANFRLERLLSAEDVYLFHGVAHDNPKDSRLFALAEVRDLTAVRDAHGVVSYPRLERMGLQALAAMRAALATFPPRERPVANRIVLDVRPPWDVPRSAWPALAGSFAPLARGAGLEKVVLRVRVPQADGNGGPDRLRDAVLHVEGVGGHGVTVREEPPGDVPVRPLTAYRQKVLLAARFGAPYPYELVRVLAPEPGTEGALPPGEFVEHELDVDDRLVPVDRPPGENTAHVVVGVVSTPTDVVPEGLTRVAILSDPTKGLGNLAEPECRRINAALDLAERMQVPVEWFAVSSGALIATDSGTENMDWIAATLRRIIEFTQAGGELNVVVTGITVGGQPYWNAEATMLMHTRGILVMTPSSTMVLTGKQALDFSGGVSAEDNFGIGGFDRVMGPNGQAQYWAPTVPDACALLLRHYELTYVVPGERFPRRRPTSDPVDRDVRPAPHEPVPGSDFRRVGDVFDAARNPERKKPFDIRSVMRAVADADSAPLERWQHWRDAENAVVWDTTIGGTCVCLLGLESRTVPRRGFVPADGPPAWTSGTLFPQASRKVARAVNATGGRRPLVVLANLSGFDGSPESMRRWQLEYGAEIGRAVTNFDGPIVFVVVSRYHGGAFVVFSKALNPQMEIAAVEGSYASVIGGAPAAATVFAREVKSRTEKDPRVAELRSRLAVATGPDAGPLRVELARTTERVRSEKLSEVADEFDAVHTIERAQRVGSVDLIIPAERLRPYVVDALERGMARAGGA